MYVDTLTYFIYMHTTRCMMHSTNGGSTRTVLHPLEYNNKSNQIKYDQIEAIWIWGCQTCMIQDGTAPKLTIFTQKVFKFVHVIIKWKTLPLLYVMNLGKSLIFHLAKYGVWVDKPPVLMTIPCILIKHNDMIYYKTNFMSEKSINL